jgi:MFS family permease
MVPRRIVLSCVTVFGLGIGSLALLRPHLWHFYLVCFLLGAVGNGTAQMGYARAVSSWFSARLGMALALVMAGTGIGAIFLPFLAQTLIAGPGWRPAYLVLGALVLVQGLPLTWRYVCERKDSGRPGTSAGQLRQREAMWQAGLRSLPFWIIVAVLFVGSVSLNGAVTQMFALLTDRGISARAAAVSVSLLGASSLIGRLLVGWLLDRFTGCRVAFVATLLPAAGLALLARLTELPTACLAAALIGFGLGAEADVTPYLLTRYYGLRSFSTLYGFTWTFYAIAGAAGPVILGRAYDVTGSYARLLTILACALASAAGLMLLLPAYPSSTEEHFPESGSRSVFVEAP